MHATAQFTITHQHNATGQHRILASWNGIVRHRTGWHSTAMGAWMVIIPTLIAGAARTHQQHPAN